MTHNRIFPLLAAGALLFTAACSSLDSDRAGADDPVEPSGLAKAADLAAPISAPTVADDAWDLTVAYRGDVRINGVACGELDTESPGDEIVTVDRLGRLRIHRQRGGTFEEIELSRIPVVGGEAAGAAAGELVQVAVGDLTPSAPGDEIVTVGVAEGGEDDGGPGAVRVYSRSGPGATWVEHRFIAPALVHAVVVGDVLGERAGNEFLVAGFFGEVLVGQLDAVGGAVTLSVRPAGVQHSGNAKGACLHGAGVVLACDDGNLIEYRHRPDGSWEVHDRVDLGEPLARVASYPTGEVAVCGNDGTFRLVSRDPAKGRTGNNFMVRAGNRLRGAVVADLDPDHGGMECATAGYDGQIRIVRVYPETRMPDGLMAVPVSDTTIARDTAKIHHLTSGRFPGLGSGRAPSLVSCGYSGDVLVLSLSK